VGPHLYTALFCAEKGRTMAEKEEKKEKEINPKFKIPEGLSTVNANKDARAKKHQKK